MGLLRLLLVAVLSACGGDAPSAPAAPPRATPEPPLEPTTPVETAPFVVELGRGQEVGADGVRVVRLGSDGEATVRRRRQVRIRGSLRRWVEATTLRLNAGQRLRLAQLVASHRIEDLEPRYRGPRRGDRTEWVLALRQGAREHVVFCENAVPPEVATLAEGIDALLDEAGLDDASWTRETMGQGDFDEALWGSAQGG